MTAVRKSKVGTDMAFVSPSNIRGGFLKKKKIISIEISGIMSVLRSKQKTPGSGCIYSPRLVLYK